MRRPLQLLALLPLALTVATTAAPASADPQAAGARTDRCTIEALDAPEDAYQVEVVAGDPTGRWIVAHLGFPGTRKHYVWEDRQLDPIRIPGHRPLVQDISSDGVMVGTRERPGTFLSSGFAVRDGETIRFRGYGRPSASTVAPVGITGDTVIGIASRHGKNVVARWSIDAPDDPEEIPLPHDFDAEDVFIAPDGSVAASGQDSDRHGASWWWDAAGTRTPLVAPNGSTDVYLSAFSGRYAVGFYDDFYPNAARWDLETGRVVKLPSEPSYQSADVSADGLIAANALSPQGALLVDRDGIETLPALGDGNWPTEANVISDDHVIAGTSVDRDHGGNARPVTWDCGG